MSPYAGQTVRVKFLVHQNGAGDGTGMYVHDVVLATPCGAPSPTPTPTPRETPTPRPRPTPHPRPRALILQGKLTASPTATDYGNGKSQGPGRVPACIASLAGRPMPRPC